MKTKFAVLCVAVVAMSAPMLIAGSKDPMVGGAAMYASKDIIDNAVNSKDHTTLVAAVKAAGTVETLLKPENKEMLTKILTYHVVAGRISTAELKKQIREGNGQATLKM